MDENFDRWKVSNELWAQIVLSRNCMFTMDENCPSGNCLLIVDRICAGQKLPCKMSYLFLDLLKRNLLQKYVLYSMCRLPYKKQKLFFIFVKIALIKQKFLYYIVNCILLYFLAEIPLLKKKKRGVTSGRNCFAKD